MSRTLVPVQNMMLVPALHRECFKGDTAWNRTDFYSRDASTHFQHPTNQVVKIWGIKNTILTRNIEISCATLTILMIPTDPASL